MHNSLPQSPVVRFAVALGIGLTALVVFYGSTHNPFVWDTRSYLGPYEFWISDLSPAHLWWMATALEMANWHPLTWLSWALDYQIYGGFSYWGFHFTNNLLHAVNSVLVFVLAMSVFRLEASHGGQWVPSRGRLLAGAAIAGLLFAVHPQHVESVAWVAERKDVLCLLFMLLSILSYLRFGANPARCKHWYGISLLIFILALASKPMAVTLPAILLLLDVFPLRRTALLSGHGSRKAVKPAGRLLAEKLPFLLFSLLSIAITLQAQQTAMKEVSLDLRLLNAFNSIVLYLQKLVLPIRLSPFYPHLVEAGGMVTWVDWLPIAAVLAVTALAIMAWRRHPAWLVAWLIYLVSLSPVLGLIQVGVQGAADRYAYFPTLPAYLLAGFGIARLLAHRTPWVRAAALATVLAALVVLANLTQSQIRIWRSPVTLWTRAVQQAPNSVLPSLRLGVAHLNTGDPERAVGVFRRLTETHPSVIDSRIFLALAYQELEEHERALRLYRELIAESGQAVHPDVDLDCAWYNRGWSRLQLGREEGALAAFRQVDPESHVGPMAAAWIARLDAENPAAVDPSAPPGTCNRPLSWMNRSS